MVLQIFRPPGDGETLSACKLGDINDAISFEYEKFFCGAGTFTLEIPAVSPFAGEIQPNVLLYDRQYGDCFVVRNVKTAADLITVTGYDLTGILRDRLVLLNTAAGETESDGHVLASGTTEAVVKQYVTNNLINAEDNTRNYPRLACAADLGRGLEKATGYAAPETVDDVIRPICEGGLLGYGIKLDITAAGSTDAPLFIFDVSERLDRSAEQDERNRVIFSIGRGNVTAMEREVGNTAYRNALWCETDADPVFVFDGEIEPASWGRREEYVSLAVVDSLDEAEVTQAARDTMADKFAQTDSLTIDAGNPLEYGEIYNLGDIVTVYDKAKKVQLDSWISAVKLTRKAGEFTVKITLGEAKPKLLDGYAKQADLLKKNQRDYPAQQEGTAKFPVLKEYEVLSDTEIKYNGVTYTFAAGESGEITGVTTDKGGAFTPTIPGTLADVSAHNAAFMAVVMLSKLSGEPEPSGDIPDCFVRFNLDSYSEDGTTITLHNQTGDGDYIATKASISDGGVAIDTASKGYGYADITTTQPTEWTCYLVIKGGTGTDRGFYIHRTGTEWNWHLVFGTGGGSYWIANFNNSATMYTSQKVKTDKCLLTVSVKEGAANYYINGTLIAQLTPTGVTLDASVRFISGRYAGSYYDSGTPQTVYDIALAATAHDATTVGEVSAMLMNKYNIGG